MITLSIKDKNLSVSGNFSLGLNLTNDEPVPDESEYSETLSFSYEDASKTARVGLASQEVTSSDIVIPAKVKHNGVVYKINKVGDFSSNDYVKSVTLPEGITEIGGMAFYNAKVNSINIPSTVTKIGSMAFDGCPLTYAKFERSSGWKVGGKAMTESEEVQMLYPDGACLLLRSTYSSVDWTRS